MHAGDGNKTEDVHEDPGSPQHHDQLQNQTKKDPDIISLELQLQCPAYANASSSN